MVFIFGNTSRCVDLNIDQVKKTFGDNVLMNMNHVAGE